MSIPSLLARCFAGALFIHAISALAVTPVPNRDIMGPCGANNRCLRGPINFYSANTDFNLQFQITNPSDVDQTVVISLNSTYDFTFQSFLDVLMRQTSLFVCNGAEDTPGDAGNIFNNHSCILPTGNIGGITVRNVPKGQTRNFAVSGKLTGIGSYDPRSSAQYKIEVVGGSGYLTGTMVYSQMEAMPFVFVPAGGGVATIRQYYQVPLNSGRPF